VKGSLLVRTGYGAELEKKLGDRAVKAVVVNDLVSAADWIATRERPTECR